VPWPPHPARTRLVHAMALSSARAWARRLCPRTAKVQLLLDRLILSCTTTHDASVVLNDILANSPAIWQINREIYPAASFMNFSSLQLVHRSARQGDRTRHKQSATQNNFLFFLFLCFRVSYFIATPCGRAGPVGKAVLKSRLKRGSNSSRSL